MTCHGPRTSSVTMTTYGGHDCVYVGGIGNTMVTRDPNIDRWRTRLKFAALGVLLAFLAALAGLVAAGRTAMDVDRAIWCEPNTLCSTPAPPIVRPTP